MESSNIISKRLTLPSPRIPHAILGSAEKIKKTKTFKS